MWTNSIVFNFRAIFLVPVYQPIKQSVKNFIRLDPDPLFLAAGFGSALRRTAGSVFTALLYCRFNPMEFSSSKLFSKGMGK